MRVLADRARLQTDAGRCAVAEMWCDGWKQKPIAGLFGYKHPALINGAIAAFIKAYVPERVDDGGYIHFYNDDRRDLAAIAIVRYRKRVVALEAAEAIPSTN